jgi:imidazoleglycerol phosphate synthase glutamine amidotransferase subunit HisH
MSESSHAKAKTPLLGDATYTAVKNIAAIVLPAFGALYFTLAQIWHLPNAEQVLGTVAAVNTFFGVVLGIATKSYNNSDTKYAGEVAFEAVDGDETTKMMVARLNTHPQVIASMDSATFKVVDK